MLILDSLHLPIYNISQSTHLSQNPIKPSYPKELSQNLNPKNTSNVLSNTHLVDWFLQTALAPKPHFPHIHLDSQKAKNRADIYASLFNKSQITNPSSQESKNLLLSDKEILTEITNHSIFYRQSLHNIAKKSNIKACDLYRGISLDKQAIQFINQIDSKLKLNMAHSITQQEVQESQKFLELQMDKVMLELYRENPKLMQEAMEKNYQLYTKGTLEKNATSNESEKISMLLLEYGIRVESHLLEDNLTNFLATIPTAMKNSINSKEVDRKAIKEIEEGINLYRGHKMEMTGYRLFSSVADRLSPEQQDKITDAIAQVLSFYSQPNTIESNGYKISWQPQYWNAKDYHSVYGMHTALSNVACADIQIAFQILLIFPTQF